MSIPVSELKAGDVLYDVHKEKAGNMGMSVEGVWKVHVREVGTEDGLPWALLSWNGDAPRKYFVIAGYKRYPKEWISSHDYMRGRGYRTCYFCTGNEVGGHDSDCPHPRAITKRKKAEHEEKKALAAEAVARLQKFGCEAESKGDKGVLVVDIQRLLDILPTPNMAEEKAYAKQRANT